MPKKKAKKKTSKKARKSKQSSAQKKKAKRKTKPVSIVAKVTDKNIPASIEEIGYSRRKLNILLGYLTFFVVAFVLSSILYSVSASVFYDNLFFMLALIFGAFSITLLVVLLIYVALRIMNK